MEIKDALWQAWLLYWFSAAFAGTFSAIITAWSIRGIVRAIIKGVKNYGNKI